MGLGQVGGALVAVVLVLVFLATSGASDLVLSTQPSGPKAARTDGKPQLSGQEKAQRTLEAARAEGLLDRDPKDKAALETAGASYALLGEYGKARGFLERLVEVDRDNVEAWRLLGEVQDKDGAGKEAATSFRRGLDAARSRGTLPLELLTDLTDLLVRQGSESEAVKLVKGLRDEVASASVAVGEGKPAVTAATGKEGVDSVDRKLASDIGAVELDLLLAKVYTKWKGHGTEGIEIYDRLIREDPEDFRPYLAKGIVYKQDGRLGDAERFFIQARFFAKTPEAKAIVARLAAAS